MSRCYRCKFRPYKDDPTEYTKIWYFAEEGAAPFDIYNVHGPQVYMDRQVPLIDWKYPGEVPGITINNGFNPTKPPGLPGCQIGEDSWFVEGVPQGLTRATVPTPPCCLPPVFPAAVGTTVGTINGPARILWDNLIGGGLLLCVFTLEDLFGTGEVPPDPIGVTVIDRGQIPLWPRWWWFVFTYQKDSVIDPDPFWPTHLGGSGAVIKIIDSSVGVYTHELVEEVGPTITIPSLTPDTPHELLVSCWASRFQQPVGLVGFDGMFIWFDIHTNYFNSINTLALVSEDPTGDRVMTYGGPFPVPAIAVEMLVR